MTHEQLEKIEALMGALIDHKIATMTGDGFEKAAVRNALAKLREKRDAAHDAIDRVDAFSNERSE